MEHNAEIKAPSNWMQPQYMWVSIAKERFQLDIYKKVQCSE